MRTVFLDTETTGLRGVYAGGTDEIVELAILDSCGNPIINQLVRPARRKSWPDAQRIHGISPVMVADAPTLHVILPEVCDAVEGCRVIIYNAAFDLQFFPKHVFRESQVECAMLRFAEWKGDWNSFYGNHRWHKLQVAAKVTGFNEDVNWHRALADTLACRHVWQYLSRCA
jgi:DNA polymerase III epsilon subunit-like protein